MRRVSGDLPEIAKAAHRQKLPIRDTNRLDSISLSTSFEQTRDSQPFPRMNSIDRNLQRD